MYPNRSSLCCRHLHVTVPAKLDKFICSHGGNPVIRQSLKPPCSLLEPRTALCRQFTMHLKPLVHCLRSLAVPSLTPFLILALLTSGKGPRRHQYHSTYLLLDQVPPQLLPQVQRQLCLETESSLSPRHQGLAAPLTFDPT